MKPAVCWLLLCLSIPLVRAQGDCDLDCYFNTTCVEGAASFSGHPTDGDGQPLDFHSDTISPNGYSCDCPEGLTGLECDRKYKSCDDGKHQCYNGGECILGVMDRFGNAQLFCDCTNAVDHNGVRHVGKYCEIPVPVLCGDDPKDETFFCVNGGQCKTDL